MQRMKDFITNSLPLQEMLKKGLQAEGQKFESTQKNEENRSGVHNNIISYIYNFLI